MAIEYKIASMHAELLIKKVKSINNLSNIKSKNDFEITTVVQF